MSKQTKIETGAGNSTAAHTPGPWNEIKTSFKIDGTTRPSFAIEGESAYGASKIIAICTGWDGGKTGSDRIAPEQAANALLIAAAPDLLNALSLIADHCLLDGTPSAAAKIARAAIAKAEGRAE